MHTRSILFFGAICTLLTACSEPPDRDPRAVQEGKRIYAKECAACHGGGVEPGTAAAGPFDVVAPDLTLLKRRNDGYFPREFVSRFVMGQLEKDDPTSPMPDFSAQGLRNVYPHGGADGEVLETDFENLLDYLEAIQR